MARPFQPGRISASDLCTGRVIWRAQDGRWVPNPDEAELITTPDRAAEALAAAEAEPNRAVGPYLAPDGPLREALRATGPRINAPHIRSHAHA